MVKNYAGDIIQDKKITPHFAIALYQETGDIGLAAETLGHSDENSTSKHYANAEEGQKQRILVNFKLKL